VYCWFPVCGLNGNVSFNRRGTIPPPIRSIGRSRFRPLPFYFAAFHDSCQFNKSGQRQHAPAYRRLQEGVMALSKKQPSRDDLAAAFRTIRDQYQIIKLQGDTIRRQEQLLGTVLLTYPRLEELRVN
jgi:hypothetical protein